MRRSAEPARRHGRWHPDISVVCGPIETAPDDPNALTNPALIVEVLSET